jgi:hypothetical protein
MSFSIRVYMNPDATEKTPENTLTAWYGSLQWVNELVEAGKLIQTRFDYFPSLYRGSAHDLLPLLAASDQGRMQG